MRISTQSSIVLPADGLWSATFDGVEPYVAPTQSNFNRNPLPPGLRWRFTILEGPSAGVQCWVITGSEPTLRNSCGRMLSGIINRPFTPDEDIELEPYYGNVYKVMIIQGSLTHQRPPMFSKAKPAPEPKPGGKK